MENASYALQNPLPSRWAHNCPRGGPETVTPGVCTVVSIPRSWEEATLTSDLCTGDTNAGQSYLSHLVSQRIPRTSNLRLDLQAMNPAASVIPRKPRTRNLRKRPLTERQGVYRGRAANPGFLQRRTPRPHSDNRVLGQEAPGGDGGRGGGEGQRGWAGAAGNPQVGRHGLPDLARGHQTAPHTTDLAAGSHFCSTRMSIGMMKTLESLTEEGRVTHLNLKPEGVSDLHLAFPRWH